MTASGSSSRRGHSAHDYRDGLPAEGPGEPHYSEKRTIDEILGSRNMKSLQPPLPQDLGASFYVQSHKLIFAVYYVHKDSHGQPKFDVFQAETSVPWLSEVLVLFTIALQLCQQLKDKVGVFYQYREFHIP
ncbi:hypothetical protein MTO96_002854 [Rhipicephalus appendiculatus]